MYAGFTQLNVTRTAPCTWVFESLPSDRAGLFSNGSLTPKGKATRTDEGLYKMPVKITFTGAGAPQCTP